MPDTDKRHLEELFALQARREAQEFECAERIDAIIQQSFQGVERTKTLLLRNFLKDPDRTCERLATKTWDLVLTDRYGPFQGKQFSIWPQERRRYLAAVANARRLPGALREWQQAREDTHVARKAYERAETALKASLPEQKQVRKPPALTREQEQHQRTLESHAKAQQDMLDRYRQEQQALQKQQAAPSRQHRRVWKLF